MDLATRIRRARFRSRVLRSPTVRWRYRGLHQDDALLLSYPRSGTTWMRFLLSEILTGRQADFATDDPPIPYVGEHRDARSILPDGGRLVMSHETLDVGTRRVVYVVRDPRAVALSEFRWLLRRGLTDADQDAFISAFVRGRSNPWGSWAAHVERWRGSASADAGHLHVVRYEDLRRDPVEAVRGALASIGAPADERTIEAAVSHNSLEAMREKEDRAPDTAFAKGVDRDVRFIGAGSVGGWREELTGPQLSRIQEAFGPTMQALGYEPDRPAP